MERVLYLIRHGQPVPQDDQKRCISRTELRLSEEGRKQAEQAGQFLAERNISALYSSPRLRCTETAEIIAQRLRLPVRTDEALTEVSVGVWEGLPFREIQERWPEAYRTRGEHIGTYAPPGGESFAEAGCRLDAALREILGKTEGELAVVAHAGIIRGWICRMTGRDPDDVFSVRQPCGGITKAVWTGEAFRVESIGLRQALPDDAEIEALYRKEKTPEPVIAHCRAVAERALQIAAPYDADRPLLRCAALLHDLCRTAGKDHPSAAAKVLDAEGWPQLAEIVGQHHDLTDDPSAEAELLALADRLTDGTDPITIQARFEASRRKCVTPEALARWRKRYDEALILERKYIKEPGKMIELYNALSDANPNARNAVMTVIGGPNFGDKCLFSAGQLVWERDEGGFFAAHAADFSGAERSGEMNVAGSRVLCEVLGGEKKLVVCGAGHVAIPLVRLGVMLGFKVTVLEDRPEFAEHAREAGAANVICAPFTEGLKQVAGDPDTFFCVITRGHSFDRECMLAICRKPYGYIGMIGSKRHGEFVREYLRDNGISEEIIGTIHTPIGLKIGSETPAEIAVSIAAEMIQVKSQSGRNSTYPRELMRAITGEQEHAENKALATIVAREGSAPCDTGAKMLVYPDGHIVGTIGGGAYEYAVMQRATAMLAAGQKNSELFTESLSAQKDESGMVCGGSLTAIIEIIEPGHSR